MTLIKWKPQPTNFINNMDSIFQSIIGDSFDFPIMDTNRVSPLVDIIEVSNEYIISADIPGFNKKDISITLDNRVLSISGKMKEDNSKLERYHYRERSGGSFQRLFNIPDDINQNEISAIIENGTLTIKLPKHEEKINKLKNIQIN